jgi:hypothetical protein
MLDFKVKVIFERLIVTKYTFGIKGINSAFNPKSMLNNCVNDQDHCHDSLN